jgi:multisubunit Na+/H+ antiporter MnhE subunit
MKVSVLLLILSFLLVGCTKAPSKLACEVWDEKLQKTGALVNYWAELSDDRTLTLEEKSKAWVDQNSYLAVLREMDSVGCKY